MSRYSLVFLALLIGCQQEIPPPATALTDADKSRIEEEVTAAFNQLVDFSMVADFDGALPLMKDDDSFSWGEGGVMFWSRQELESALRPAFASLQGQASRDMKTEVNVLGGDAAVLSVDMECNATLQDGTVTPWQRCVATFVWKQEGDGWKVIHGHESYSALPVTE